MKKTVLIITLLFFISCNDTVTNDDVTHLKGYWEIKKAVMPDGSVKEYTINSTIDYFKISGTKGYRKKVVPQYDGTYLVNDTFENITIVENDDKMYLNYKTKFSEWNEQIITVDENQLVVKNEQDIEYHYAKNKSIKIRDGETTE